ncbi:MAG: peptide deformylase [Elusimicrobia bacterium CG08_land_8_20_14_0_20_44_26]|nr:MAG: peptide deformylase [Elusimicrobia bacterium CG08_land_8_20_14_0_20_44_26]
MVSEVVLIGSQRLRSVSEEVRSVGAKIQKLFDDMIDTMCAGKGIGLAAIQIGVPLRMIVANPTGFSKDLVCLVNPVVESSSGKSVMKEGCLSIPGIFSEVKRPEKISVTGINRAGKPVKMELSGLKSRIIQHEIDHLNGKLFIDYLSIVKKIYLYPKIYRIKKTGRSPKGTGSNL